MLLYLNNKNDNLEAKNCSKKLKGLCFDSTVLMISKKIKIKYY